MLCNGVRFSFASKMYLVPPSMIVHRSVEYLDFIDGWLAVGWPIRERTASSHSRRRRSSRRGKRKREIFFPSIKLLQPRTQQVDGISTHFKPRAKSSWKTMDTRAKACQCPYMVPTKTYSKSRIRKMANSSSFLFILKQMKTLRSTGLHLMTQPILG